jgi:hypothetical protein
MVALDPVRPLRPPVSKALGEAIMSQFVVVVFSDKVGADKGSLSLKKLGTEGMTIYRSVVCTENFIRIDWSKESPNVSAQ